MNRRARGTEQNAENTRMQNRDVKLYAVTELAKGLDSPTQWAIALTGFRLFGKWLIQPSNFCWSVWPPKTSSFISARMIKPIIITGSANPGLPQMGQPVFASSSMALQVVRDAAILTVL